MNIPSGRCDRQVVNDQINGLLYGAVMGATLGLATDGMTKEEVDRKYTKQNPLQFEQIADGQIPSQLRENAVDVHHFNSDIVELLLMLQAVLMPDNRPVHKKYRDQLWRYVQGRSPGWSNKASQRVRMSDTIEAVVKHPKFMDDHFDAAIDVWRENPRLRDTSGVLIRATLLGIPDYWLHTRFMENTTNCCRVTHPDPHCMIACAIVSNLVARSLNQRQASDKENVMPLPLPSPPPCPTSSGTSSPSYLDKSPCFTDELTCAKKKTLPIDELPGSEPLLELVSHVLGILKPTEDPLLKSEGIDVEQIQRNHIDYEILKRQWSAKAITLASLNLGSPGHHHVFQCLNASLYAFTREIPAGTETDYFESILTDIVMQGGNAASNAAVAGALLGVRLGYNKLPQEWSASLHSLELLYNLFDNFSDHFSVRDPRDYHTQPIVHS